MAPDLTSAPPTQHGGGGRRGLHVARCALCGLELPLGLLVPDGGHACADLRWYCKDAKACTERWTARRAAERHRSP